MRILFIEPSTYNKKGLKKDTVYRDSMRSTRTLGLTLPYVAALTPNDIDVTIAFDVCEEIEKAYDLQSFDLVGITCQTLQMKRALELAVHLRRLGVPAVVGGPATIEDDSRLVRVLSRFFDAVVVGEAETLWLKALQDWRNGTLQKVYRDETFVPLKGLPVPRFDLVNFDLIAQPHVYPALTSRGCPRTCDFCSEFLYSPWRWRPDDEVIAELNAYQSRFGAERVVFRDDDFLVYPRRSRALLQKMVPLSLEWACQTDLNLARHPDVARLAVQAGLRSVSFGLESVRASNRDAVSKGFFTLPQAKELLLMLHESGVETQVNIIFGLDNDTPDIFDETVDFLLQCRVSSFFASVLFPIPGTKLYNRLKIEGRLLGEHPPGIEDPAYVGFVPKQMSPEQLVEGFKRAQTRFYSERNSQNVYWLGAENHIWTGEDDLVLC
jgi:radical SAM superfamily enzyme YgiQ (UPF0313 family)